MAIAESMTLLRHFTRWVQIKLHYLLYREVLIIEDLRDIEEVPVSISKEQAARESEETIAKLDYAIRGIRVDREQAMRTLRQIQRQMQHVGDGEAIHEALDEYNRTSSLLEDLEQKKADQIKWLEQWS